MNIDNDIHESIKESIRIEENSSNNNSWDDLCKIFELNNSKIKELKQRGDDKSKFALK